MGILVNRKGKITHVIIGNDRQIVIPEIEVKRTGQKRLSGLRLIHTHLKDEGVTRDDLNDLALLRLDMVVVANILHDGSPGQTYLAHLNPGEKEPHTIHGPSSFEETDSLFQGLISQIETELETVAAPYAVKAGHKAMLIHVSNSSQKSMDFSLDELAELSRTAGIAVADRITQRRDQIDPKYLMGKGKLEEFMINALAHGIDLVIFDTELTASQLKSISDFTDIEVMDRSQLILGIFEKRAKSRDGKVRVSLAKMRYLLPRLGAKESALSRIRGGIGLRGPGQTTAEVLRRHLQTRIARLEKELNVLKGRRELLRKSRVSAGAKIVSVIGYTNAGKSTLVNRLTGSTLYTEDLLFATLDPSVRKLRLPDGEPAAVIGDTVGLIRNMPESIVGVFRATLEELSESDLIINLVDVSNPNFSDHIETSKKILHDIGLVEIPSLTVFNKADRMDSEEVLAQCKRYDALAVSAKSGEGIDRLLEGIKGKLTGKES